MHRAFDKHRKPKLRGSIGAFALGGDNDACGRQAVQHGVETVELLRVEVLIRAVKQADVLDKCCRIDRRVPLRIRNVADPDRRRFLFLHWNRGQRVFRRLALLEVLRDVVHLATREPRGFRGFPQVGGAG